MKNESQAITESFNVENTLNKSLMDSASIQRSWCCNIPKCFADSSVQADEEPRKNPSLITKTATVEGVRLTFSQDNDEGIRSKRKWSGKSKGLNMKRKIRRTFTLCCYHGQSVSSDEDEEENVYTGDSRESALPKEPPGRLKQNIGCLRSKKHELNGPWALEMNDSETTEADEWKTVAKFANSKAIRGVSNLNVTPGLVQPNKNRNTPQWNLSDRATLSSGANKQTVVNTELGSFKALANAYTTEATKNQTNLSASGIDGSEINNRRIKTAKRRLKKSTKVEDESSPTVSMQPEVNQSRDPLKTEVSQSAAPSKPKVPKSSVPPKPESYQSNVPTQAQTFPPPLTSKPAFDQQAASLQSEGNRSTMPLHSEATQSASKHQNKQKDSRLRPLHFVDTDGDTSSLKVNEAPPIFIETDATIDYGRCVVEPGHGERPDKKKLRAEIKEKVKTKGEANKHLKTEKENYFPLYEDVMEAYFADSGADIDVSIDDGNASEEEPEGARAASPIVLNAVDQPQVLDDREMNMVPETIKRVDDPYLVDVEEDYKVSTTHSNKKDKRKQKDERRKEKKSKKANQTILKFS